MNTDIRVAVSFKGNRKRKKFKMLLGDPSATDYLIDFWLSVATDRAEGDLTGLENLDIALMAGWEGDSDKFVNALAAAGFLDGEPGRYQVHAWAEHNGYASNANVRSEAARKASAARWKGKNGTAEKDNEQSDGNADGMRPHKKGNPPSPSPSPSPSPDKSTPRKRAGNFTPPALQDVKAYCLERKNGVDPERFVDFYACKGWMVGKNKMKDWRAAVRNWEKGQKGNPGHSPATPETLPPPTCKGCIITECDPGKKAKGRGCSSWTDE